MLRRVNLKGGEEYGILNKHVMNGMDRDKYEC